MKDHKRWIGKDLQGSGHDIFKSDIPVFVSTRRDKPRKTPGMITGNKGNIRAMCFETARLERYLYTNMLCN
jgi:hypothetical protein